MALISLDNVSKIYPKGTRPALDDINLDIERGDFVFLVGASGSGKTTLLSLLLREEEATSGTAEKVSFGSMLKRPYFALGVLAEFIFIGLQVAGMSLFSTFAMQQWPGMTAGTAAAYLSILSLLFTVGRFVSTPIMAKVDAGKLLGVYMTASAVLFFVAFLGLGPVSVIAMIVSYLFVSIGYPVVFSLTLTGFQGSAVKTGSSALVMSIVGAALSPLVMSAVADAAGINVALLLAVPGFLYVAWYGLFGSKLGLERK